MERVRQVQERRQEDRMVVIGRMASSIIHDIKNPMAAIQGYAHLIASQSPDHRHYAEIIISEIDRLVGMTKELLDFSKGGRSLQIVKASWSDFVVDVAEVLSRDLENQGIELQTEIEESGEVDFDPDRMRRVLFNLAGNARDAMPEGGRLVLATDSSEDSVGLEVRDNGIGMDAKTLSRVFTPFFSSKGDGGTGLGTSIVKSVVEAHHGKVLAESTPGRGSVFRVELPRRQPENGN
jgi:two-component system sporulation sensor kinase A